ncbi:hypothetical protein LG331_09015 [Vreelandella aquamarina]|uniref:hypothetical protein n=1 Tax=Vreelandella aquamarina TaxID=77097 RepID=UPI003850B572
MATAPTVPNFSQYNFELGDRSAVVTKQNGLNAALAQFGNSLAVMTESINDDLTVMEQQKSATQQAAQAGSESAQQAAADRQAVAEDRAHVDQQKQAIDTTAGQVNSHAQQVATDKQTVADNTATATQAAQDAGAAAGASIQAKNDAQALYGDLAAVDAAKSDAQQAATTATQGAQTATEKAQEASELLANAGTAFDKDAQETLTDATPGRLALVGAFGGYGAKLASEQYPLSDVETPPVDIASGRYSFNTAFHTNLPPVEGGATFGTIEVIPLSDSNNRNKLVVRTGAAGHPFEEWERAYIGAGGWVGPWKKVGEAKYRDVVGPDSEPLMSKGAFGLGAKAPIATDYFSSANFNDFNVPDGSYTVAGTWLNGPLGNGNHTGLVEVKGRVFGNQTVQVFRNRSIANSEVYERWGDGANDIWYPWQLVYKQNNIIGTVSQSGGMPTGAVFERDSNSLGTWIKHADGSMTCGGFYSGVVDITTTGFVTAGARRSATITQDYPQPFISTPVIEFTLSYDSTGPNTYFDITACQFTSVNSDIRFGMVFTAPVAVTGAEVRLSWTAFGRWY